MRRHRLLPLAMLPGLFACTATPAPEPAGTGAGRPAADRAEEDRIRGRALADRFQKDLSAALMQAMRTGGPVKAVSVCADQAPALAQALSREAHARVRRVSLRPRNPQAAPDSTERRVLEAFARQPQQADGRPAEWTEHAPSGRVRYMRAIPTGPLCLTCHGPAVAPDVRAAIVARYPRDRATGYAVGEPRGAFSISWRAPGGRNL